MKFDKIVVYWEGNVIIETFLDYEQQVGTDFGYIGVHWEGNGWTWPDHSKINFTNNWSGTDFFTLTHFDHDFFLSQSTNRSIFSSQFFITFKETFSKLVQLSNHFVLLFLCIICLLVESFDFWTKSWLFWQLCLVCPRKWR